jgi:exodeoxyribonuclease VII large subunit
MSQALLFDLVPQRRVWKVSEITQQIGNIIEGTFPDVWIEGEVSNFRAVPSSGHLYFTLKDSRAQIRCVCFREQARLLKFRPGDGLHITLRGSLGVYETRGEYQVYVSYIEPVGLGALQLAFEQLKKQLQQEGLFEQSRKKPLPVLPHCIGVISSPTGAAIRDILRVLKRRFANVHVQLYPVRVQGDGAAGDIVAALRHFDRMKFAEVLILARGGGSLEDLWAFNEEIVARAIAESSIPVITGVGHETDFTIADFVADVRAPTPSAAAEIVVRSRQEFERHISEYQRQLIHHTRYLLSERRHRVRDLETHRAFRQLELLLRHRRQQVDELSNSLSMDLRLRLGAFHERLTKSSAQLLSFDLRSRASALRRRIAQQDSQLHGALGRSLAQKRRLFSAAHLRFAALDLRGRVSKLRHGCELKSSELRVRMDRLLVARRRRVEAATLQLRERSPFQLLERGYAIAYDAAGRVLRSPDQVELGAEISVRLARGQLAAAVRNKKKFEQEGS